MPFPNPSNGLLRTLVRPVRTAAPVRSTQIRTQVAHGKETIGGAGGQRVPPPNPGYREILQRNWVPVAGAAFAVLVGYAYITRNPEEARQQRDKTLGEMSGRTKTEMGGFRHD